MVPCYNEAETLPSSARTLERLLEKMITDEQISSESTIRFVNDGSCDCTWALICELCSRKGTHFRGVNLSRNFGHQSALLAGLFSSRADACVSIDADLQDDVNVVPKMVEKFRAGADIVYGVRARRDTDTFFKKWTALAFYAVRDWLAGGKTIRNHADFRLMSRRAINALKSFPETNLYLRGLIPMLGFPSAKVFYDRRARELGESKYPLSKMLKLAWNGIVNFSDVPLKMLTAAGLLGGAACGCALVFALVQWLRGETVPGWATIVFAVAAVGSVQMISLGILGSYIAKIFLETKRRPPFIIQETIGGNEACSRET
ncbi:MAG: glycosyltransferase family 2 protein [Candidatus Spyradosoma sp.]